MGQYFPPLRDVAGAERNGDRDARRPLSGLYQDWHPASRRQLLVVLSGTLEIETSDGEKHRCSSGEVFLADDVGSRGHRSRTIGGPARVLFVHLPPEADLGG
jgi:hypothetical protein